MTAFSQVQQDDLFKDLGKFRRLFAGMLVLAERAPERLTMSQALFFLVAGTMDIGGSDPTYTEVRRAVGETLNKSLNTTYRIFLEPSRLYPNGLGWLRQELNPDDNRVKILRLTTAGRAVFEDLARHCGS